MHVSVCFLRIHVVRAAKHSTCMLLLSQHCTNCWHHAVALCKPTELECRAELQVSAILVTTTRACGPDRASRADLKGKVRKPML
jgi:hypothetical protein